MSLLIPVAFAVFACCCAVQFHCLGQVRQALALRHPDVLRRISAKGWFLDNAVSRFAWSRACTMLNDPDLTRKARRFRMLSIVMIGAWIACLVAMFA